MCLRNTLNLLDTEKRFSLINYLKQGIFDSEHSHKIVRLNSKITKRKLFTKKFDFMQILVNTDKCMPVTVSYQKNLHSSSSSEIDKLERKHSASLISNVVYSGEMEVKIEPAIITHRNASSNPSQ